MRDERLHNEGANSPVEVGGEDRMVKWLVSSVTYRSILVPVIDWKVSSQLEPVAMELEVISPVFVEGQSKEYLNEKGSKEQDDRHT